MGSPSRRSPLTPSSRGKRKLRQSSSDVSCDKEIQHYESQAKRREIEGDISKPAIEAAYRASLILEPQERLLSSFDLEGVARYITEKGCHKIVVMCGAGISTSAGIPDFRTPGTGLYDNLQRFELPSPNSIFDINFFREQPRAFYELAKEIWPGKHSPTPSHYFIRLLHEKGLLLRCYSQNIDSLERVAGLPAEKLVAAHGNFDAAHVVREDGNKDPRLDVDVDIDELKTAIDRGEQGWQALRREKGGLVKPRIAFFGESLPRRFMQMHKQDLPECDLLIVLGTSLVVQPFVSLIGRAARTAPRLLVNNEPAGTSDRFPEYGFRFHLTKEGQNSRDAWHQGDCDSGCRRLAAELGWTSELDALIESKGEVNVAQQRAVVSNSEFRGAGGKLDDIGFAGA